MLDLHTTEHGYQEVYPPFMVKRECMVGSGNLPKFADNLYHDEEDDFWFVPTAEVPITNLHRDEIIPPGSLPFYYVAYTACFRREKLSAGKDTRGIKRGHQFDKVELYKFTEPETSNEELEKMVNDAEEVCQKLGLPHPRYQTTVRPHPERLRASPAQSDDWHNGELPTKRWHHCSPRGSPAVCGGEGDKISQNYFPGY
jgi:seryl-tRNA synthetase